MDGQIGRRTDCQASSANDTEPIGIKKGGVTSTPSFGYNYCNIIIIIIGLIRPTVSSSVVY